MFSPSKFIKKLAIASTFLMFFSNIAFAEEMEFSVKVSVGVSDTLKYQIKPEEVLYVVAKPVEGPKSPLAVYRGTAKEIPLNVTLDDSMAMSPLFSLSTLRGTKVKVIARISHDGQAIKSPGDFYGESEAFTVEKTNKPVKVTIGKVFH